MLRTLFIIFFVGTFLWAAGLMCGKVSADDLLAPTSDFQNNNSLRVFKRYDVRGRRIHRDDRQVDVDFESWLRGLTLNPELKRAVTYELLDLQVIYELLLNAFYAIRMAPSESLHRYTQGDEDYLYGDFLFLANKTESGLTIEMFNEGEPFSETVLDRLLLEKITTKPETIDHGGEGFWTRVRRYLMHDRGAVVEVASQLDNGILKSYRYRCPSDGENLQRQSVVVNLEEMKGYTTRIILYFPFSRSRQLPSGINKNAVDRSL